METAVPRLLTNYKLEGLTLLAKFGSLWIWERLQQFRIGELWTSLEVLVRQPPTSTLLTRARDDRVE